MSSQAALVATPSQRLPYGQCLLDYFVISLLDFLLTSQIRVNTFVVAFIISNRFTMARTNSATEFFGRPVNRLSTHIFPPESGLQTAPRHLQAVKNLRVIDVDVDK
jgi:hypothetical protein